MLYPLYAIDISLVIGRGERMDSRLRRSGLRPALRASVGAARLGVNLRLLPPEGKPYRYWLSVTYRMPTIDGGLSIANLLEFNRLSPCSQIGNMLAWFCEDYCSQYTPRFLAEKERC